MHPFRRISCLIHGGHRYTNYGFDDCESCLMCGKRMLNRFQLRRYERRHTDGL